jgi:hypothetical protein
MTEPDWDKVSPYWSPEQCAQWAESQRTITPGPLQFDPTEAQRIELPTQRLKWKGRYRLQANVVTIWFGLFILGVCVTLITIGARNHL